MTDEELIARAEDLRQEAKQLLEQDGLLTCFAQADTVEVVGSVSTDLMTKRDIDITCCLDPLESDRLLALGRSVVEKLPVARMTYINPSVMPWHDYTVGLYCNVRIQATPDALWNVDVWAYAPDDFNTAMQKHHDLAARLSKIDRLLLLRLKSCSAEQSHVVYTAVLHHGVRRKEELDKYTEAQMGQPAAEPDPDVHRDRLAASLCC